MDRIQVVSRELRFLLEERRATSLSRCHSKYAPAHRGVIIKGDTGGPPTVIYDEIETTTGVREEKEERKEEKKKYRFL